jgi:tetratricopeptide (TPR) repeat protein
MTNMTQWKFPLLTLAFFSALPPATGLAGTQAEYQALQSWCVGRDKWSAEGRKTDYPHPDEYFHFHHYCSGMNALNSLYSTVDTRKQRYQAGLVVNETGYVIGHVPENHFLMPEVYALRGRGLLLAKQLPQAETSLLKALQLDPRHLGAHLSLGTLYLETNRKPKAIETAKAGLAIDPQHKGLRRLAGELGIKLEEVKLAPPQQQPVTPPSASPTTPPTAPSSTTAPPGAPPSKPVRQEVDKPAEKTREAPKSSDTAPANAGSATNPWCRFCPETPSSDRPASSPAAAPKAAP